MIFNTKFQLSITIRGYELDSFGHVNNSVYLNYLEQARWEILKEKNLLEYFKSEKLFLVVTESYIRYIKELTLFQEIVIETEIENVSPYIIFHHKIINKESGAKHAKAKIKTLLIDQKRIPQDIPKDFLA